MINKIKRYVGYAKKFSRSSNKKVLIGTLVQQVRSQGLLNGFRIFLSQRGVLSEALEQHSQFSSIEVKRRLEEYLRNAHSTADIIVLVSHDMSRSGAPLLLLNIARELCCTHQKKIILVSLTDGELRSEFEKVSHLICINQKQVGHIEEVQYIDNLFYMLSDYSVSSVLVNTTLGFLFVPILQKYGFQYQILIHELPDVIEKMGWSQTVKKNYCQLHNARVIYSSEFVRQRHIKEYGMIETSDIIPQGIFHNVIQGINPQSQESLREKYSLPLNSYIVMSGGSDIYRKGLDLFCQIADKVTAFNKKIYFIYLCDRSSDAFMYFSKYKFNGNPNCIFDDLASNYSLYLEGSYIYALTSREDPFPNVMLDSLAHGLPVIAFDECGGAPAILQDIDITLVAKHLDIDDFANKILCLLEDKELYSSISEKALDVVKEFQFDRYVNKLSLYYRDNVFHPYIVKEKPSGFTKKVMHIIGNFNVGGSSQLVVDIIERVADYKHFVVTQFVPRPQKYLGVDIWQIDSNIKDLRKLLIETNPCIIHVHYWGRLDHSWYEKIYGILGEFDIPVIQNINVPIQPLISQSNVLYVYVSDYVKRLFGIQKDELEQVVYPGSDFALFSSRFLDELTDAEYVGMVYRLDSDKVNEKSIEPFIELCKINSEVKCMIVGDGALLPLYKKRVEESGFIDKFVFTGYVSYSDLPTIYNKFRIFLAPVFDESFGQVSPFAMSIGMPVVAYNTGALSEIIADGSLLADTGNAIQLAKICNDLWFDNERLLSIAKFNQNRAKKYFSVESMIHSYKNIYQKFDSKVKSRYLIVSLNPMAQKGGGADVLWVELAAALSRRSATVHLLVHSRSNLSDQVSRLIDIGVVVSYFDEIGYKVLKFSFDIAVFFQGDHNEGGEWFKRCFAQKLPYAIVNQLTKEAFWPDEHTAELVSFGYKHAFRTFFTCDNNRQLMERQIGASLTNAERHFNPIGVPKDVCIPYPKVLNDEYHLACPARFSVVHKGQDILFEVMKQNKWKQRKLIINFYGNGPDKSRLENLKTFYDIQNINFCEYSDDIRDIWRNNHGLVMPSRMEGVPIVLLGAMLCMRVPIVTDVGGHRELIDDEYSGFIAKAPTVNFMDEVLEKAWQARSGWESMGQRARASVLDFQAENPVEALIEKL